MRRRWLLALGRLRKAGRWASSKSTRARVLTVITCMVAGFMIATSALVSRDGELRPNRNTELVELVRSQARHHEQLTDHLTALRTDVETLTGYQTGDPDQVDAAVERAAGMVALRGPGIRVTLTDAPLSVQPAGVDEDLLVVHQQDIQAVVNALWSADAEAMAIQGQRVNSRTGIKCVGNTVVLEGVPYAPPYVIEAIGDTNAMARALERSPHLKIYRQYVDAYRLGYDVTPLADVTVPAHRGAVDFQHAQPVD